MISSDSAEVWLYGSHARGDSDELSDVDLLVISDEFIADDLLLYSTPASVSRYSWREVEHMVEYGSLFLVHVRMEGKPLVETSDRKFWSLLRSMPPYMRANQELESFETVVADVSKSLQGDHSPPFELAVLGTAARHAAILGCYLLGTPVFSRREPFKKLLPCLNYDAADVAEFEGLYDFRVYENRGEIPPLVASSESAQIWVPRVRELIRRVKGIL
jgi:predicted nucleotidyltransferase